MKEKKKRICFKKAFILIIFSCIILNLSFSANTNFQTHTNSVLNPESNENNYNLEISEIFNLPSPNNGRNYPLTNLNQGPIHKMYSHDTSGMLRVYNKSESGYVEVWNNDAEFSGSVFATYGDVNGNGEMEIIAGSGHFSDKKLIIYGKNGENNYNNIWQTSLPSEVWSIHSADLNGNGIDEIMVGTKYSGLFIFAFDGDESYTQIYHSSGITGHVHNIRSGDIDNNGNINIVLVIGTSQNMVVVMECIELNNIIVNWQSSSYSYEFSYVALGDIDNDGYLEILTHNHEVRAVIFKYMGNNIYQERYSIPNSGFPVAFDINQDGKNEIIVSSNSNLFAWNISSNDEIENIWVYSNNEGYSISSVFVVDVDFDGNHEIMTGSHDSSLYLIFSYQDGSENGSEDENLRDPIYINGNSHFIEANGVTSGNGSQEAPYIIEDVIIDASSNHGIEIRNSDAHLIIRNCVIKNGNQSGNYGMLLYNVKNIKIFNNTLLSNYNGIYSSLSEYNTFSNNTLISNHYDAFALDRSTNNLFANNSVSMTGGRAFHLWASSSNNNILNNTLTKNYGGIWLSSASNNNLIGNNNFLNNSKYQAQSRDTTGNSWFYEETGNFWSDYTDFYPNASHDGRVWNTSYSIIEDGFEDPFPLVHPTQSFENQSGLMGILVLQDESLEFIIQSLDQDIKPFDPSCVIYNVNNSNFVVDGFGTLTNTSILPVGIYSLNISAEDNTGTQIFVVITITVVDTIAPVWDTSLDHVSLEFFEDALFKELLSEDHSSPIFYSVNNTEYFEIFDGNILRNKTDTVLSVGEYSLSLTAEDASSNQNNKTITITVVDTTPPAWILEPEDATLEFFSQALIQHIEGSDPSGVFYIVNDTNFNIDGSGLLTNTTILLVGTYNLNITAEDSVGNQICETIVISVVTPVQDGIEEDVDYPVQDDSDNGDDQLAQDDDKFESQIGIMGYPTPTIIMAISFGLLLVKRKQRNTAAV